MVIGIYLSYGNQYVGGGYVYQKCLFDEIVSKQQTAYARHRIIFFYHGENDLIDDRTGRCVNVAWYNGGLNEAVMRHKVDLVWFLSIATVDIDIPHILPVWDLQHCLQTFFPEVSSGGEYLARNKAYQHFLPRATYILTGTEQGKKEISFFYRIPEDRIVVTPLPLPQYMSGEPVERPGELAPFGLERGNFIFYPAQFWPHKNHVALLETLRILKSTSELRLKLVLTGSDHGNLRYVREQIAEKGLVEDVALLGFVETQSILWLYQNAFALTYPSFFGPDNIPPLEAFSAGCPVIAANVKGALDQMGDAALLVDPQDEKGFAAALLRLAREPRLRETLVDRGRRVAQERTAEAYVRNVFELMDGFSSIRRCWGSHFRIKYTPDLMDWLNGYLKNKEMHALATLLSLCCDEPLEEMRATVTSRFQEIDAANKVAEESIARGDQATASGILNKILSECVDYPPVFLNLAKIHFSRKEVDKAYEFIQRAKHHASRLDIELQAAAGQG